MKSLKLLLIFVMSLSFFESTLGMKGQNNNDTHQDKKQRGLDNIPDDIDRRDLLEIEDISSFKSLKFLCAQKLLLTDWRSIQLPEDLIEYLTALGSINVYINSLINNLSEIRDKILNYGYMPEHIQKEIKEFDYYNGQHNIQCHKLLLYKLIESGKIDLRFITNLLESFMVILNSYQPVASYEYVNICVSDINLLLKMLVFHRASDNIDTNEIKKLHNIGFSGVLALQEYLCFLLKTRGFFPDLNTFSENKFGLLGKLLARDLSAEGLKLLIRIVGEKNPLWKLIFEALNEFNRNILHCCLCSKHFKDIPEILEILINLALENDVDLEKLFNQWGNTIFVGKKETPYICFLNMNYGNYSLEIYSKIADVFAKYGAEIDWVDKRYDKSRVLVKIIEPLAVIFDFARMTAWKNFPSFEDCEQIEIYINLMLNMLEKLFPKIDDLADMNFSASIMIDDKDLKFNLAKPEDLKNLLNLIQEKKLKIMNQFVDIVL